MGNHLKRFSPSSAFSKTSYCWHTTVTIFMCANVAIKILFNSKGKHLCKDKVCSQIWKISVNYTREKCQPQGKQFMCWIWTTLQDFLQSWMLILAKTACDKAVGGDTSREKMHEFPVEEPIKFQEDLHTTWTNRLSIGSPSIILSGATCSEAGCKNCISLYELCV